MIHLYCGDGKGKTTCAMGLALRAAGRGWPVAVAQFLKGADSGERAALAHVPGVTLLPVPETLPFLFQMTPAQRQAEAGRSAALLEEGARLLRTGRCRMLVLDEVCAALTCGLLEERAVLDLLDCRPEGGEVVLTGRDPLPSLRDRADYLTELTAVRHPYDRGFPARSGVEF